MVLSFRASVGGFDLAAEWAGWTNAFNCEIDLFCRRVLKYHFPNAIQYEDIKTTDFTVWRGRINVITGGFPCQPFSVAGKRKGTDDDRYLWPEMLRAIREIRPRWVVGENVRGFVSWSDGMVLDTVFADLEALGYEVLPFVLPACAVNAPHRRDRVWIVAHRADAGAENMRERSEQADAERFGGEQIVPYTSGSRLQRTMSSDAELFAELFSKFPTQSPVRCGNDGLFAGLDAIPFPAWCRKSIKAYGNAIVPQVFYQIAETINQYEKL